jgi:hypothetical protein
MSYFSWMSRKIMVRGIGARALAMFVVLASAMAAIASPALAFTWGISPSLACSLNTNGAEIVARDMPPEPANGATVPAGTAVTFSGESNQALTFNVASSPALLSSPDIDSGTGSQSGTFYRFTSTKATATPRTIYWTASFTFTPGECESSSTFTTPVHTLIVASSAAESAAAKAQQEKEAAEKSMEEEAAARKTAEEAAAAGSVVLDGVTISVESNHAAAIELTCSDVSRCAGKLTLTVSATAGKGKTPKTKTKSIGTAGFSIAAGAKTTVMVSLNKVGRALLGAAHRGIGALLTIFRASPPPNKVQSQHVHLDLRRPI